MSQNIYIYIYIYTYIYIYIYYAYCASLEPGASFSAGLDVSIVCSEGSLGLKFRGLEFGALGLRGLGFQV